MDIPPEAVEKIAHLAIDDFIPYLQGRMAMTLSVDTLLQVQVVADDFKENVVTAGLFPDQPTEEG